MPLRVVNLYRYPVKGLSPEPLERVDLKPGEGVANDRRFALAHGSTRFDPAAAEWLPKTNFLMLMRNERLARLRTRFDDASGTLTIERDGKLVLKSNILDHSGRMVAEQFFTAFAGSEARGAPRLIESPGHMFSDSRHKVISIIGLASIRDLERVARLPVDPRRFRANLYFDGGRPWQEFGWPGQEIGVGGVRLRVRSRIGRCAATDVNPETARRDMTIPRTLQDGFGHVDLGIYAEVLTNGAIAVGDELCAG